MLWLSEASGGGDAFGGLPAGQEYGLRSPELLLPKTGDIAGLWGLKPDDKKNEDK